jgi:hypothetical protein
MNQTQQNNLFWCYNCLQETQIQTTFQCSRCKRDNLELITPENDPRKFNVYNSNQTQTP